jgi:aldehyde dehydrogenase
VTRFVAPRQPEALVSYEPRYDHWIGGEYVEPAGGRYFENPSPVTGETFGEIARGTCRVGRRSTDTSAYRGTGKP